jgi:catechol 2,3-dioxygenase-like lactoylglutathione lyase family enzyme
MIIKVTHITLFVKNAEESLAFYTKMLGCVVHTDASFNGERWLTIHPKNQPELEIALIEATTPEMKALVGKQAGSLPLLNFESTDCYKDYEELCKKGVTFHAKPKDEPWGIATSFEDVNGNVLYMCQPKEFTGK